MTTRNPPNRPKINLGNRVTHCDFGFFMPGTVVGFGGVPGLCEYVQVRFDFDGVIRVCREENIYRAKFYEGGKAEIPGTDRG